jgi:diguanylate cyclase (GGDEF)-like protein
VLAGNFLYRKSKEYSLAIAFSSYAFGALIAGLSNSQLANQISNYLYFAFYPFFFFSYLKQNQRIQSAIVNTLTSSLTIPILAITTLKGFYQINLPLLFQASLSLDFFLTFITLFALIRQLTLLNLLYFLGSFLFALADLYLAVSNWNTSLDALLNDSWIFALIILAIARQLRTKSSQVINFLVIQIFLVIYALALTLLMSFKLFPYQKYNLPLTLLSAIPPICSLFLAYFQQHHEISKLNLYKEDPLTGLPGRRYLNESAKEYLKSTGALLLLDLNKFKYINDNFGHEVGDEVLIHAATRFQKAAPANSLLARLGGDEFVLLIEAHTESIVEITQRIYHSLSYPIYTDKYEFSLGVSIGYVTFQALVAENLELSIEKIIAHADKAMYRAKNTGIGIAKWNVETDGRN